MLVSLPAAARFDEPRYGTKKVNIYIPHYKVRPRHDKIYTPDRYSCRMRRQLKYCIDSKGNALDGQIVVTNGSAVAYETYQNGYQNGETSIYSVDGNLVERVWYKKGLRNGEAVEYYLNGNVWLIKHYNDGVLHGRVEEYGINGGLIGQMNYKKGWFKSGYCANEKSGKTMYERTQKEEYNKIIPCSANTDELM